MKKIRLWIWLASLLPAAFCMVPIESADAQATEPGQVVASGTVPDEASRAAILERLRELYGANKIVDQLDVGGVVTPPQWTTGVQRLLTSDLKNVSRGELHIEGMQVTVKGETVNEAIRQQVVSQIASVLPSNYIVMNALRVKAGGQEQLDKTLADRIVEFQSGSATLTAVGRAVLTDMATVLQKVGARRVEISGHTDSVGSRQANLVLSQARADSVKSYLIGAGISAEYLSSVGVGPDRPIAGNNSESGRARNRRIEFRLLN